MPGAIVKQIVGELSKSKTKGAAFVKELNAALSPEKIAKEMPKTQPCKKGY